MKLRSLIPGFIGLPGLLLFVLAGCQTPFRPAPTPVPGISLPFEVIVNEPYAYNSEEVVFDSDEFKAYVVNSPEDIPPLLTMLLPEVVDNLSLETRLQSVSLQDAFLLALFRRRGSSSCDAFAVREIKNDRGHIFVSLDARNGQGEECLATETRRWALIKVERIPSDLAPRSEDVTIIPRYVAQPAPGR